MLCVRERLLHDRSQVLCERGCSMVGIRHSFCEEDKELCGMREGIPEVREGAL